MPKKILLVEDNDLNGDMLSRRLTRHGYDVIIATDGPEGIRMALLYRPDIILMDISLPGIDGWEATRQIKSSLNNMPIIALTAHAMIEDEQKALAAGCDDFDTKPIDLTRLLNKISNLINNTSPVVEKPGNTEQCLIKKNLSIMNDLVDQITNYLSHINFFTAKNAQYHHHGSDLKNIHTAINDLKSKIAYYMTENDDNIFNELWRSACHELRTKVGSVSGYASIILEEINYEQNDFVVNLKQIIATAELILSAIENIKIDSRSALAATENSIQNHLFCFLGDIPKKSTILLVDDSTDKRTLIKRRLIASHHEILEVQSAEEALKLIENVPIDLILLDLILPGMSGYNLLVLLKEKPATADIPILITSSLNEMGSIVECIRAGAEDYLPTPIDKTLLLARVNASLSKKKLIDQSKHYQHEIIKMQKCLDAALQSVNDGFVIYDQNDRIYMCNQHFQQLYPCLVDVYPLNDITYEQFLKLNYDQNLYCSLDEQIQAYPSSNPNYFTQWARDRLAKHCQPDQPYLEQFRDGRWIEIKEKLIPQGGIVAIHSDVTQRIEHEQQYQHIATHDQLTGLYNRHFLEKILLSTIKSYQGKMFAVLFFDLDGFKAVNDQFGHRHGDFLLKSVASKLSDTLRSDDTLARIGGDEFCALIPRFNNVKELGELALRCAKAVGDSVEYKGKQMNFGISIGVAYYPKHGNTPETLLSHADNAMYIAKKSGNNQYHIAQ